MSSGSEFFGSSPEPTGASEREPDDQTFADVLNGLTLGGGRRRRAKPAEPPRPAPTPARPPAPAEVTVPSPAPRREVAAEPWPTEADSAESEAGEDAAIVRPYAWTQGRTKSTVDFRIETMVSTSELGEDIEAMTQTEHRSVARLCLEPRSVAEVATLLAVPLGVAKVLLGDMSGLGLIIVHKTATGGANRAHLKLMERVLSGLRRL